MSKLKLRIHCWANYGTFSVRELSLLKEEYRKVFLENDTVKFSRRAFEGRTIEFSPEEVMENETLKELFQENNNPKVYIGNIYEEGYGYMVDLINHGFVNLKTNGRDYVTCELAKDKVVDCLTRGSLVLKNYDCLEKRIEECIALKNIEWLTKAECSPWEVNVLEIRDKIKFTTQEVFWLLLANEPDARFVYLDGQDELEYNNYDNDLVCIKDGKRMLTMGVPVLMSIFDVEALEIYNKFKSRNEKQYHRKNYEGYCF